MANLNTGKETYQKVGDELNNLLKANFMQIQSQNWNNTDYIIDFNYCARSIPAGEKIGDYFKKIAVAMGGKWSHPKVASSDPVDPTPMHFRATFNSRGTQISFMEALDDAARGVLAQMKPVAPNQSPGPR